MGNLDSNQRVADRRASREHEAENHRLVTHSDDTPALGEPRLRYVRKHRTPNLRRESLAGS
jgi:hypothetical protein